jgi:hypothetical protein
MGDVVALEAVRGQRRVQDAVRHPALRWTAGSDGHTYSHRQCVHGTMACGAHGDARVAEPGTPPCPDCYPPAASG